MNNINLIYDQREKITPLSSNKAVQTVNYVYRIFAIPSSGKVVARAWTISASPSEGY
jgi:hypothetical protein